LGITILVWPKNAFHAKVSSQRTQNLRLVSAISTFVKTLCLGDFVAFKILNLDLGF